VLQSIACVVPIEEIPTVEVSCFFCLRFTGRGR